MTYQKPVLHDFFPMEAVGSSCQSGSTATYPCYEGGNVDPSCQYGDSPATCASGASASSECNYGNNHHNGYDCSYGYSTGGCDEGQCANSACGGGNTYYSCGYGHVAMLGCGEGALPS
jgi:hypothetical protein